MYNIDVIIYTPTKKGHLAWPHETTAYFCFDGNMRLARKPTRKGDRLA